LSEVDLRQARHNLLNAGLIAYQTDLPQPKNRPNFIRFPKPVNLSDFDTGVDNKLL
jgi:hypothetical protein